MNILILECLKLYFSFRLQLNLSVSEIKVSLSHYIRFNSWMTQWWCMNLCTTPLSSPDKNDTSVITGKKWCERASARSIHCKSCLSDLFCFIRCKTGHWRHSNVVFRLTGHRWDCRGVVQGDFRVFLSACSSVSKCGLNYQEMDQSNITRELHYCL